MTRQEKLNYMNVVSDWLKKRDSWAIEIKSIRSSLADQLERLKQLEKLIARKQ